MSAEGSHLMTALPRRETRVNGVLLILAYMVALVTPLVVAGIVRPKTGHTILWELGKNFALVAVVILVLQFVLAARRRRICRHYGLGDLAPANESRLNVTIWGIWRQGRAV